MASMNDMCRRALSSQLAAFIDDLDVDNILPLLQAPSDGITVITEAMAEEIMAERTVRGRRRLLMMKLPSRSQAAFDRFAEALITVGQEYFIDYMNACPELTVKIDKNALKEKVERMRNRRVSESQALSPSTPTAPESRMPATNENFPSDPHDGLLSCITGGAQGGGKRSPPYRRPTATDRVIESKQTSLKPPKYDDEYDLHGCATKGHVLIINNEKFLDPDNNRPGSNQDCEKLQDLFTHLGFEDPIVARNKTAKGMNEAIDKFIKKNDWDDAASAVIVFLSHGDKDGVLCTLLGIDMEPVYLRDVITKLGPKNCPGLKGKPKIIIVQACRGIRYDGTDAAAHFPKQEERNDADVQLLTGDDIAQGIPLPISDLEEQTDASGGAAAFSSIQDILICFATGWDYFAYRNPLTGSCYINEMDRVLRNRAIASKRIETVLMEIQRGIVSQRKQDQMQCPGYYTHLMKKLRLLPKPNKQPIST